MKALIALMQKQADLVNGRKTATRIGTVSGYDPNYYAVKVALQPEGTETGWIPLGSAWVGNGWGLFSPPSIGDMVEIEFQEGDIEAALCCHRFFNDVERPLAVPSGEFWLIHKSGSSLKFFNDGTVELHAALNLSVQVDGELVANVTGNMTATVGGQVSVTTPDKIVFSASEVDIQGILKVSGDITDNTGSGNIKTVGDMRSVYDSHHHTGVTVGAGNTGGPVPTI